MKNIPTPNCKIAVLFAFALLSLPALAQSPFTITGRITNEKNEPFPDVSVRLSNGSGGTVSDATGTYRIMVPGPKSLLLFSHIGYLTQSILVGGRRGIDVSMATDSVRLSDVVVVGYARQKAVTVTGSVASVTGDKLVSTPVSNVANMLVGNAPGVSGLQASGEPGRNGAAIYIRGVSTFSGGNSSQPLVVIDNIEQAPERAYDQLNSMDANEIESISILKDASSTAVYGIRGANGVIIVTTRRGRSSKPSLSASANFGYTKATALMHNANSYQYATMRNEAIRTEINAFGNSSFANNLFSDNDLARLQIGRDYLPSEVDAMSGLTDPQKIRLKNSAPLYYGSRDLFADQFGGTGGQRQLNLNISGGTSRVKYFTSLGYFSQGSILRTIDYYGAKVASTFGRYNFRTNLDIDVVKNFQISVNLAGQFGETAGPGLTGGDAFNLDGRYKAIMQYIFDSNPLTAPGIVDGKLVNGYFGQAGTPSNPLAIVLGSLKGNQNAIYNLLASGNETVYNTFLSGSVVLRHTMSYLVKGLSLRGTINFDDNYIKTTTFQPSLPTYQVRRSPLDPGTLEFVGGAIGAANFNANPGRNATWYKYYFDGGLDYAGHFGDHNVTALALAKGSKYYVPTTDNFYTPSAVLGLLGRVTYNFREKYLVEGNIGYNGTEQFREGKRFGVFPAVSLGWVITNEKLIPRNDYLTFFKVRASYGEVGNDQLGNNRRYLFLPSTYNLGQSGYYFGNSDGSVANPLFTGTAEGNLGNPFVTWERAKKKNLGVDARFFTDRFTVTFDYFSEKRDNILTQLDQIIPYTYGVPATSVPPQNVGRVNNHGYELSLGWNGKGRDFTWFINGNVSYARNKIIYKAESPKPYPWMYQKGFSIGQYKGLVADGFYNTQAELDSRPYLTYNANKTTLGDVRYKDVNGDGLIDNRDLVPIGYSNLPQYIYSLRFGGSYHGFDVSILIDGSAKGSFDLSQYQFANAPFYQTAGNLMDWQFAGRWSSDKVAKGQQNTIKYPRATINGGAGSNGNFLTSSLWLLSSDYLRLKNIGVGYTFRNPRGLKKVGISGLRIYGNANNVHIFHSDMARFGIDPEASNRTGYAIYPNTMAVVFGANLQF